RRPESGSADVQQHVGHLDAGATATIALHQARGDGPRARLLAGGLDELLAHLQIAARRDQLLVQRPCGAREHWQRNHGHGNQQSADALLPAATAAVSEAADARRAWRMRPKILWRV